MALRHKSREYALQMLFQWEVGHQPTERIELGFWQMVRAEKTTRAFANSLFEGAAHASAEMDVAFARHTENWRLERLALIDRAILRLASYELQTGQTPPKVVLNEAIELAKKFSSENAAGFINGVLDALLHFKEGKAKKDGASNSESA